MDLKSFIIDDYLKGKPVYPAARRLLSFVFSVSITSFLFERLFFRYSLIDISDYKSIFDFFVKGFFFVPFFLYVIVYLLLDAVSRIAYGLLISIKSDKYLQEILRTKYKKSEAKRIIKALNDKTQIPFVMSEPWLFAIYQHFTHTFSQEQWNKMLTELEKAKRSNEDNFRLVVKALISITIYLAIVPYFGWKLYALSLLLLTGMGIVLFWLYLVMEVLPLGIQKIHADVTDYFARQQENQTPPPNT